MRTLECSVSLCVLHSLCSSVESPSPSCHVSVPVQLLSFKNHFHKVSQADSKLWAHGDALNIPLRVKIKSIFGFGLFFYRWNTAQVFFFNVLSTEDKTNGHWSDHQFSFHASVCSLFGHLVQLSRACRMNSGVIEGRYFAATAGSQTHLCGTDNTCVFTGQDHGSTGRQMWSK